jgi:hypothetical protein
METNEKLKRKYKKHKDGFKISVRYNLNTRLKGTTFSPGVELYPVYIEVRAKRQKSDFRSFYSFYVSPDQFEVFLNSDIAKKLFAIETERIIKTIEDYDKITNDFVIKNWFSEYQLFKSDEIISEKLRRRIFSKLEANYFGNDEGLESLKNVLVSKIDFAQPTIDFLIPIKLATKSPILEEVIESLRTFLRIKEVLRQYSKEWLYPEISGIFYLENSMDTHTLFFNHNIRERIEVIGSQSNSLLRDIEDIKSFLNE